MAEVLSLLNQHRSAIDLLASQKRYPRHAPFSLNPIIRGVIGNLSFAMLAYTIDLIFYSNFSMQPCPKLGWFLLLYLILIFFVRMYETKTSSTIYELAWGCNIGITMTGIGCLYGRCMLIGIAIGLVGLDQMVWYLDCISFLLRQKYFLGAAAYLSHPEQTYLRSITSLHHLWFLPYTMYCLYIGGSYLHSHAFIISMFPIGMGSICYGKYFIPKFSWNVLSENVKKRILRQKKERKKKKRHSDEHCMIDGRYYLEYLNVNCGHEFYPTVPIPFLHYANSKPFYIYLPMITAFLIPASFIPFLFMKLISNVLLI